MNPDQLSPLHISSIAAGENPDADAILSFQQEVLAFYHEHGRHDMVWRHTTDPYQIVVSERMLQQTQVERVAQKFPLFIAAFPDFAALAAVPLHEILAVWQGMGYNRRALFLKKDLDTAASESVKTLEALSIDTQQNYSPIWYVHSDWTIQRNLEVLVEGVTSKLIVFCFNRETLTKFKGPITSIAQDRTVKILFPKGSAGGIAPHDGIRCYEVGTPTDFFGVNVFGKIFSAPIQRDGVLFRLECILIADDQQSMLIYTQNGKRMAVIITLPFITCVQSRLFSQMIENAHEIQCDEKDTGESKNMKGKKSRGKRRATES